MTARRRNPARALRTRYPARHAAWTRHRSMDQHVADTLADDDLMALADAVQADPLEQLWAMPPAQVQR